MENCVNVKLLEFLLRIIKDKVGFMSTKLKNLSGKTAKELLSLLGEDVAPPIDIERIYKKLSIPFNSFDFSASEEKLRKTTGFSEDDKILGAVLVDPSEDVYVFYRKEDTENRMRFTLAHELAHCCIDAAGLKQGHIEFRSDSVSNSGLEYEANVFAGELLIPEPLLVKEYNKMIAPLSDVLARIFGVSTNVMEKRLDYLQLPYYKPVVPNT